MSSPTQPIPLHFTGPQESFAEIIAKYQNLVYATVFSIIGNPQQSEDIAQETFLAAWKNYGTLQDEEKLSSWLCGIARNLSRKWLRDNYKNARNNTESLSNFADEPAQTDSTPEQPVREEAALLVWDSLKHLSEKYREPLVMFYQNQSSVREIAGALELSEDVVKQRLSRGRRQLKKIVEQQFSAALEVLKPRETFCLAVLAAIPLAASTTEVLAATGAVIAGKSTVSTTPTSGGAAFLGLCWANILTVAFSLVFYVSLFFGINHVLQSSPTLRSRRLMIQVVLWHYLVIFFAWCVYAAIVKNIPSEPVMQNIVLNVAFLSGAVGLVGYTIFTCGYFNTRWRRIVEEDMGECPIPSVDLEKSSLSLTSLRHQIIGVFSLVVVYILFALIYDAITGGYYFDGKHSPMLRIGIFFWAQVPHLVLALVVISMYGSTRNEETFRKYPSKYPEILDDLTGKSSTRRRPYFLIDACVLYLSLLFFCWCGFHLPHRGFEKIGEPMAHAAVLCGCFQILFLVSWIWQLVRYAGIPRKRYWGFVIFGSVQGVIALTILLISKGALTGKIDPSYFGSFFVSMCIFVSSVYIAMVSAGIIGLRVFRRENPLPLPVPTRPCGDLE